LFITPAYAQAAGAPAGAGDFIGMVLPLVLIMGVFYFLLIRPQAKRAKEHKALIASLSAGDEVVTGGGILGKVTEVSEQFLVVEVAEGVRVKVQRHTVTQVLPKGSVKSA